MKHFLGKVEMIYALWILFDTNIFFYKDLLQLTMDNGRNMVG